METKDPPDLCSTAAPSAWRTFSRCTTGSRLQRRSGSDPVDLAATGTPPTGCPAGTRLTRRTTTSRVKLRPAEALKKKKGPHLAVALSTESPGRRASPSRVQAGESDSAALWPEIYRRKLSGGRGEGWSYIYLDLLDRNNKLEALHPVELQSVLFWRSFTESWKYLKTNLFMWLKLKLMFAESRKTKENYVDNLNICKNEA